MNREFILHIMILVLVILFMLQQFEYSVALNQLKSCFYRCNYLNFRRNMVCLKCDHRRPKAANSSDSSVQPQIEEKGRNIRKMGFVRNQGNIDDQTSVMITRRKNRKEGFGMRRFVEDRNESHQSAYSWNDTSQFDSFPISGGKSELSKSSKKREAWKKEMMKRNKSSLETTESEEDGFWSDSDQSDKETSYFTDDQEMEEWFGVGKLKKNGTLGSKSH